MAALQGHQCRIKQWLQLVRHGDLLVVGLGMTETSMKESGVYASIITEYSCLQFQWAIRKSTITTQVYIQLRQCASYLPALFSFNLFLFSTFCICFIATKIILKTEERGDRRGGSACRERNKEEKIRPSFPQLYMDLMVKYQND